MATRHADALEDLVEARFQGNDVKAEAEIGADDGSAAKIAIGADTPDGARLALLDLDVTADELRGRLLRWDSGMSAWQPTADE